MTFTLTHIIKMKFDSLFFNYGDIMTDKEYMQRAIELARRGVGAVDPNPLVGAVIVKDGKIIGEGWHAKYGEFHAERNAIKNLTESAEGATIYVTLEPCCHHGKQPPCTDAIIENKIKRVVIGSRDPNPLVSGKGAAILRSHGISVEEDFMRSECDELNPVFFHYITTKTPYVVMKYAMTADGKTATHTCASKWITGEASRQRVQEMRYTYTGIMVGIGTVLADDPMLNVRTKGKRSPVRIICDSSLRIPTDCNIVKTAGQYKTIVACSLDDNEINDNAALYSKAAILRKSGIEIINAKGTYGKTDLKLLIKLLGERGINSLLLEGGGTLNESALRSNIVNEVRVFVAPKLFGGADAPTPVMGGGVSLPSEAYKLNLRSTECIDGDILLNYKIIYK